MAQLPNSGDEDGIIVFTTGAETRKGRALRRQRRVCLCVDDETPPFSFVMVDGDVELSDDLSVMLEWATRIGERYMGAGRAEEYGRRNGVSGEVLVRLTPTRVVAHRGIAD